MTPELEKYYSDRFTMFLSQGWKDFIEDVEKIKEVTDNIDRLNTAEDLWFCIGQLDILNWILGLKASSEEAYKELSDEKDI